MIKLDSISPLSDESLPRTINRVSSNNLGTWISSLAAPWIHAAALLPPF